MHDRYVSDGNNPFCDCQIVLTSPSGTTSNLLTRRYRDITSSGFEDWEFTSVHFWGENPSGNWTFSIYTSEHSGNHSNKTRQVNQNAVIR